MIISNFPGVFSRIQKLFSLPTATLSLNKLCNSLNIRTKAFAKFVNNSEIKLRSLPNKNTSLKHWILLSYFRDTNIF